MGFWVAKADSSGLRITGSEIQLSPAPIAVDYPTAPLGSILETADGRVIQQQPAKDNRQRAWLWRGLPGYLANFPTLWNALNSLRSTYRKAYGQSTPWIYVKEDVTDELRRQVLYTGTSSASGATNNPNKLTDSLKAWTVNGLTGYYCEIISGTGQGQVRVVASNTATVLTMTTNWTTNPDTTSVYRVSSWISDYFRARVVSLSRTPAARAGVSYDEIRLGFVIDDASWNFLG